MPDPRPFRFGIQLRDAHDAEDWRERVRRVADAGYAVVSMPDHLDRQLAPLPALMAAADAAPELRLATWVLANDFRHPVVLAKQAATLDLLSDGRLQLGIGAGWMASDYATSGIDYDAPGVRVQRLREAIAVLRGAWGEGAFSFAGTHYRVDALDGYPKPAQPGGPPLAIGGGGRRVLSLAAREADIVGLGARLVSGRMDAAAGPSLTAEATDRKIGWVREAAGERWGALELNARVLIAEVDAPERAEEIGRGLGLDAAAVAASPHALFGELEQIEQHLLRCRERWGLSYFTLSEGARDAFAPLVARLAGT